MSIATLLAVVMAGAAWRRGDDVAKWVLAAYIPMTASVVANSARARPIPVASNA